MVIDRAAFERVIPQGDFANIRIRLEASISPEESAGDAVRALDRKISEILSGADAAPVETSQKNTAPACG